MSDRDDRVKAWYPRYPADFIASTKDLNADEGWAYTCLLDHLWMEGASLDYEPQRLARLANCAWKIWPDVWKRISKFFDVKDGRITQKRTSWEYSEAVKKRRKKRVAGKLGAKARWGGTDAPQDADAMIRSTANDATSAIAPEPQSQWPLPSPLPLPDPEARAAARDTGEVFREALELFCRLWLTRHGVAYEPTQADRSSLGRMLKSEVAKAALPGALLAYFADDSAFVAGEQQHSLRWFCAMANKYRAKAARATARHGPYFKPDPATPPDARGWSGREGQG